MIEPKQLPYSNSAFPQSPIDLSLAEILPRDLYAQRRPDWLPLMRGYLKARRLRLGPFATLLFENACTVRHQLQEVLHWETTNNREARKRSSEELEIYRGLLPGSDALTASLLIDGGSLETGLAFGKALASGQKTIGLLVGSTSVAAELSDQDSDPAEPVKFLRFPLDTRLRQAIIANMPVSVWIEIHRQRSVQTLPATTRASLAFDLTNT